MTATTHIHANKKIGTALRSASAGNYSVVSLQGGSRCGKTYTTILFLITQALELPKIRISIVRATLPALKGSAVVDFVEIMQKIGLWNESRFNKSNLIYEFSNGSVIEFFSCDNEQKLRGRKRDILFCNEANELTEIMYQQLKMRTGLYCILDYNPSFTADHWIFALNNEPTTNHVITTYLDNLKHLPPEIIREIESLKDKNANLWQIYGLGQMATIEGVVFPKFDQVDEIPAEIDHKFIGIDFGYTNDCTAIVEVGIEGDKLFVNEIVYSVKLFSTDIIRILTPYRRYEVVSESADPRLVDEIRAGGINITPVKKFPGSITAGVQKLQTMNIHVTKNSLNIIKELQNYCYKKDANGQYTNEVVDAFNHAIDAIRYVILTKAMNKPRNGVTKAIVI